MKFRYSVKYRRSDSATRTYHVTVTARDADEAREYARMRDPRFGSTVSSPRRGAAVIELNRVTFDGERHGPIDIEVA